MSAVEKIQAAIDKLERVKTHLTIVQKLHVDGFSSGLVGYEGLLLDTLGPQLEILRHGLAVAKHWEAVLDKLSGTMRTPLDHALLIADAILGDAS